MPLELGLASLLFSMKGSSQFLIPRRACFSLSADQLAERSPSCGSLSGQCAHNRVS
jgi:hypothetical protein